MEETPTVLYHRRRGAKVARVKIRWNAAEQQWEMRGYGPLHGNNKFLGYCKKATDLVNHLNKVPKEQRMKFAFRGSFGTPEEVARCNGRRWVTLEHQQPTKRVIL